MLTRKDVCNIILKRMQQRNFTPEHLASISSVHKNTINRLKSEDFYNPRLDTLSLVLDSLGLEPVILNKNVTITFTDKRKGKELSDLTSTAPPLELCKRIPAG